LRRRETNTQGYKELRFSFVAPPRVENLLHGCNDLADTTRRLQAYESAGADVLYAPGLRDLAEVRHVVGAVKRPVNVVTGWLDPGITVGQLAEAGAKRISLGARCRGLRSPR
jgi:2-methylisocitrate lyase-like PEP mutase family enzyme